MEKIENNSLYDEDISYNHYLYKKRLELKMKRRKFAKMLNISPFHYKLIENGYIKPTKNDIEKISKFFEIDYSFFCVESRSYPYEINHKKFMRITNYLYHLFTKKKVRITFLILFLLSLITLITSACTQPRFEASNASNYEPIVTEFNETLKEKGNPNFSIFSLNYPLVSKNVQINDEVQKSVIIKGTYNKGLSISFIEIIWFENYRFYLNYSRFNDDILWSMVILNYKTYENVSAMLIDYGDSYELLPFADMDAYNLFSEYLKNANIRKDFDDLINEELGLETKFNDYITSYNKTVAKNAMITLRLLITTFLSLVFTVIFLFLFGYSSIYKKERGEQFSFSHSDELLGLNPKMEKIKGDIKIFPFIPETFLKIAGIILVAVGSIRLIFYTLNITLYDYHNIENANTFYSIQLLGMFIIFFLNFDIYMDDYRLFRNLMLYPIIFFLVYLVEASIMQAIATNPSVFTLAASNVMLPNPFASATCYFLIMLFLFFTPKFLKTKRSLIIFRCLSIIPILFIFISFFLANIDVIFGVQISNQYFRYFFRSDRLPLSILAVSYLVSLYFLRLHFKKKYGEEKANKYFMGNRYIILKNLIAFSLIIIIWIFEMIFKNNQTLNKMGIGLNTYLIILAPLLLFYHPHKGARNTKVDVTLISFYAIMLIIIYIATGIIALVGFVS